MTQPDKIDRYLCLSIDVVGYGGHDDRTQAAIQRRLIDLLDVAAAEAGVDRGLWIRQAKGDEELALVPAGGGVARVVGGFCLELAAALLRNNLRAGPEGPIRLRVGADEGLVEPGDNGFVGRPVVGATRLGASQAAREALAAAPAASLVVVLAAGVHRDWVQSGRSGLPQEQFRLVRVHEKETETDAWVWTPGTLQGTADVPAPEPAAPEPVAAAPVATVGGRTIIQNGTHSTYIERAADVHFGYGRG
ncbi:hypothetical protein AB0J72_34420 [Dactylosporangium sp. NPDC049742]|uniref:hypothetical protein n=1 Tax=Dactylosporangium sp. NPDC049742 TaxID=3154737 RepID=UPI003445E8CC